MEPTLTEGIVGLLAAVAAYFSIRAKLEAGAANKAVNHTEDGAPRLYDIALGNATNLAAIRERVRNVEKSCDKLQEGQESHCKELRDHASALDKQEALLESICNRAKEDE
jgi:TolA-binding protein